MSFPQTRHTLIQRLVVQGDDRDWQIFLVDYWGPICRFAMRRGGLSLADAEDIASGTFEALIKNRLLERWVSARTAKLRTLLCAVARNILANRARVQAGRERLLREQAGQPGELPLGSVLDAPAEQVDAFYAAWVEEVLQQSVDHLFKTYHQARKGDYFRVLYGRICEEMSVPEIAQALNLPKTTVENYYRHAREQLAKQLEESVRQIDRYAAEADREGEFLEEWGRLGDYLKEHGGLEQAVRRTHALPNAASAPKTLHTARTRLSEIMLRTHPPQNPSKM